MHISATLKSQMKNEGEQKQNRGLHLEGLLYDRVK